jgi:SAM-dependent methyltransferase
MTETVEATEAAGAGAATAEAVGAVLGQLMGDFAATAGVVLTALGRRLGLWDALAAGPASAETVARRAGAAVPCVREWLRSQAAAGYLGYDPATETFALAPGAGAVLGDGPLSGLTDGMAAQFGVWWSELERYEEAFRTGQGISWGALPAAHAEGMDMITRAVVAPALVGEWLPALDGVVARLSAGAAVADVGCGYGAPSIAMAGAFPASVFSGFDVDDASVARARKAALAAGVAERVSFEVAAAADVPGGRYDLVTFIDSLHDLGDPVGALRRTRQVLADDGVVLLAEHAGSGRLEENLHPAGRFFYAASALVCVPNALAQPHPGSPLGAIPGEQALRDAAAAAGFSRVRRVEAGAPLNLLIELRP